MRRTPHLSRLLILLLCLPLFCSCASHQQGAASQLTTELSRAEQQAADHPGQLQAQKDPELAAADQSADDDLTPPEGEANANQEVQDLEKLGAWESGVPRTPKGNIIHSDFPITVNRQVEYYLDLFQNQQRKIFAGWLARSGRYLPYIQKQLAEAGLPQDLAYLSMIESGFKLTAYSTAGAAGLWQFIPGTATRFGLQVNDYMDERRDPVRSTQAAIQYLKDLHGQFDNWYMAVAAYNAGERKISCGVQKYNCNNFWDLAKENFLALETKRYVPQLIAAIIIAKSPKDYGFDNIAYDAPLAYETVRVPARTPLAAVAVATNTNLDALHDLNRQLTKMETPPGLAAYELKVPPGAGHLVVANLPRVHASVSTHFKEHVVGRHDTIARVCARFHLSRITLLKANNLHKDRLIPGTILRIPYQTAQYALLSEAEIGRLAKTDATPEQLKVHTVRHGDTISRIAAQYGISEHEIMALNRLKSSHLKVGQRLTLVANDKEAGRLEGHGHPQVAKREVKAREQVAARDKAAAAHSPRQQTTTRYRVKSGDSLWAIAERFSLSPDDIKRWNNLDSNEIMPGATLIIKTKG